MTSTSVTRTRARSCRRSQQWAQVGVSDDDEALHDGQSACRRPRNVQRAAALNSALTPSKLRTMLRRTSLSSVHRHRAASFDDPNSGSSRRHVVFAGVRDEAEPVFNLCFGKHVRHSSVHISGEDPETYLGHPLLLQCAVKTRMSWEVGDFASDTEDRGSRIYAVKAGR
jgi:hypothetical protein